MNVALPLACQALATNGIFTDVIDAATADVMPSASARVEGTSRFFISHCQKTSARTLPAQFAYALRDDTKRTTGVMRWPICVLVGFSGLNNDRGQSDALGNNRQYPPSG